MPPGLLIFPFLISPKTLTLTALRNLDALVRCTLTKKHRSLFAQHQNLKSPTHIMTANDQIPSHVEDIAADIVRRCHVLLQEMGQLRERLFAMRGENQHISGLVTQMSSVRTEKIAAESFLASLKDERNPWKGNAEARFRSSNIPAVDQLWTIIKGHCRHITSVHHHVVAHPRVDAIRKKGSSFHESYSNLKPRKAKQTAGRKKTGDDGIYVSAVVDGVRTLLYFFSSIFNFQNTLP